MFLKQKHKKKPIRSSTPELALELLPYALARNNYSDPQMLQMVLSRINAKKLKRIGLTALGVGVAVSLAKSLARGRMLRFSVGRELKKQLAPVNKKLDELEKQNDELKKQNEQLKKQLR